VKITNALAAAAAVAAAGSLGLLGAPLATADDLTTTTIGNEAKLTDGNVVQGWTITGLKPSTDLIPYPVAGTLWEASATDQAIRGSATPIVSNLNARARDGQTYRVLFGAATPQGVNPATLAQGEKTSGKVYFDVVGENPDSVVYNAGGQDLLVWVQPPPQLPAQRGGGSYSSSSPAASSPTPGTTPTTPATPTAVPGAPAGVEGTTAPATALPAGSQGTPIPAGSQGTPLAPGSQGTPVAPATPSTPAPAGAEGAPQPASVQEGTAPTGSQGTPLPASGPTTAAVPTNPTAPTTTVAVSPPS
jgi:hypothetical protein